MTKAQQDYNKKAILGIVAVGLFMVTLKIIGITINTSLLTNCRYYPYRNTAHGLECLTYKTAREQHWNKMKDIEQERKKLFALAQKGNKKAQRKLQKLNYDESIRKLNRK